MGVGAVIDVGLSALEGNIPEDPRELPKALRDVAGVWESF